MPFLFSTLKTELLINRRQKDKYFFIFVQNFLFDFNLNTKTSNPRKSIFPQRVGSSTKNKILPFLLYGALKCFEFIV